MPKSKAKKNIKVRDLKPSKDAKGGGHGTSPTGGGTSISGHGTSPTGGGTSVSGGGTSGR
jgi:hypothetical protein